MDIDDKRFKSLFITALRVKKWLNLASGLVTSCNGCKTVGWRLACPYLRWGSMRIGDPNKINKVKLRAAAFNRLRFKQHFWCFQKNVLVQLQWLPVCQYSWWRDLNARLCKTCYHRTLMLKDQMQLNIMICINKESEWDVIKEEWVILMRKISATTWRVMWRNKFRGSHTAMSDD